MSQPDAPAPSLAERLTDDAIAALMRTVAQMRLERRTTVLIRVDELDALLTVPALSPEPPPAPPTPLLALETCDRCGHAHACLAPTEAR